RGSRPAGGLSPSYIRQTFASPFLADLRAPRAPVSRSASPVVAVVVEATATAAFVVADVHHSATLAGVFAGDGAGRRRRHRREGGDSALAVRPRGRGQRDDRVAMGATELREEDLAALGRPHPPEILE